MSKRPSPAEIVAAKHDCIELMTRFFGCYDSRDYDRLFSLMTPNGVWNRGTDGPSRVGEELAQSLAKRKASLAVVHLLSNMVAEWGADGRVTVKGIMSIVRDEEGALKPPPAKIAPISAILAFTATCEKLGDDWRVAELGSKYLFRA